MPPMLIFRPSFHPGPVIMRIIIPLLLAALLGACGYKGPLYLPKPKPETQPAKPAQAPSQDPRKAGTQEPAGQ